MLAGAKKVTIIEFAKPIVYSGVTRNYKRLVRNEKRFVPYIYLV